MPKGINFWYAVKQELANECHETIYYRTRDEADFHLHLIPYMQSGGAWLEITRAIIVRVPEAEVPAVARIGEN